MIHLFLLATLASTFSCTAHTIKVKNETPYPIKALILYHPGSAKEMLSTAFGATEKEPKIDVLQGNMDSSMYGFEGAFGKKNKKYFKQSSYIKPGETISKDVGTGCVREAKVWIVKKMSIPANEVTLDMVNQGDASGTTLGKEYKKLSDNKADWNLKVANKTPISYVKYDPILKGKNWDTRAVKSKENQCASHTFKAFIKGNNDITLELD
jgi:hypothetical protein